MAKHTTLRLLRPPKPTKTTTAHQPPGQHLLRRSPGPLPPATHLLRKPLQPGPPLSKAQIANHETIHHGQHIYLYTNIHTNQVVYSLTRHLNNAAALAQLPFLGKKTQPAHLRKDLWTPLALAYFPSPHAGVDAYRRLREFRKRHETEYPLDLIRDPKNKLLLLPKRKRGKVLMDQKANSVADLAAVLGQLEVGVSEQRRARWERVRKRVAWETRIRGLRGKDSAGERRRARLEKVDVVKAFGGVDGVVVRWVDLRDAEFAEKWPEAVLHLGLGKSRYTAAWPQREVTEEKKEEEEAAAKGAAGGGKGAVVKESHVPSEEAVKQGLAATPPKRSWRELLFGPKSAGMATAA